MKKFIGEIILNELYKNCNYDIDRLKEVLSEKPYCLSINNYKNYYCLSYIQFLSDFTNEFVCQSRGTIYKLENNYFKAVCVPFYKFFNYSEPLAAKIDWNNFKVLEKIDGSIMKLWWDEEWHISSNSVINPEGFTVGISGKNLKELFLEAAKKQNLGFDKLDKNYTYIFELVTPFNQIVIPYPETKIYFLSARNMKSFQEKNMDIGIEKPQQYEFKNLNDIIKITEELKDKEGFVIVDKNYNRIKIKTLSYIKQHYLINNKVFSINRIIEIIEKGEMDEVMSYCSRELREIIYRIYTNIQMIFFCFEKEKEKVFSNKIENRKQLAELIKNNPFQKQLFMYYDNKIQSFEDYWNMLDVDGKVNIYKKWKTNIYIQYDNK